MQCEDIKTDILVITGKPLRQLVDIHRPFVMQEPEKFNPLRCQQPVCRVNALGKDPLNRLFLFFPRLDQLLICGFWRGTSGEKKTGVV
jgi:hypothetical protein